VNLRRNNHYLPECYQQGFTDNTGRVWFKEGGKPPVPRRPKSVGLKRSLYIRNVNGVESDGIEGFFDREVEKSFALLSQRVRAEREKFGSISLEEGAALLRFIASQSVRTVAHRQCVDEQAGYEVNKNVFLDTMLRQMKQMCAAWAQNPPKLRFFTSLPYIGEYFISGDHPVVVIYQTDDKVFIPRDEPERRITQLSDILSRPNCGFWLPLSSYVCVSVQPRDREQAYLPPEPMDPQQVHRLNNFVRGQCQRFILARDKQSLN
jgi:hypothetical protein